MMQVFFVCGYRDNKASAGMESTTAVKNNESYADGGGTHQQCYQFCLVHYTDRGSQLEPVWMYESAQCAVSVGTIDFDTIKRLCCSMASIKENTLHARDVQE